MTTAKRARRNSSGTDQLVAALRVAQTAAAMDTEDAAVFIADESRHPYDWQAIHDNRSTYRRCLRQAERNIAAAGLTHLEPRLAEAQRVLNRKHRL